MPLPIIEEINKIIQGHFYFEMHIFSYNDGMLIVGGSEDFLYYHELEICFEHVFAVHGNFYWKVDNKKTCLAVIEGEEAYELNIKYGVEKGYSIFRFTGDHEPESITYIIVRKICFQHKTVKYCKE